PLMANLQG
ncbi:hypothetical protein D043_4098B, partial [Vibrio parahaemolyticus EKP-021]